MKRIRLVGLCLTAAFALSALCAMPATQAHAAEYGECLKTKKVGKVYKGRFSDKNCTEEAAPEEEEEGGSNNKYEFYPGLKASKKLTSKSKAASLKSAAGNIACSASTSEGELDVPVTIDGEEVPAPRGSTDRSTFTGCTLSLTGGKCSSAGESAGTIRTNLLDAALIGTGETGLGGKEPTGEGEIWNEFVSAEDEPYVAVYICEPGVMFRTLGSLSCPVTPVNEMGKKSEDACAESEGEQDLETEYSENGGETWSSTGKNEMSLKQGSKTPKDETENFRCINTYGLGNPKKRKFLNEDNCKKFAGPNDGNYEREYKK